MVVSRLVAFVLGFVVAVALTRRQRKPGSIVRAAVWQNGAGERWPSPTERRLLDG